MHEVTVPGGMLASCFLQGKTQTAQCFPGLVRVLSLEQELIKGRSSTYCNGLLRRYTWTLPPTS